MEMLKLLAKYNCNWEEEDSEGQTPLFYAIKSGN